MAYFTESEARQAFRATYRTATASAAISDVRSKGVGRTQFDVFLSHSSKDAELILGARELLRRLGLEVYVDWIDDPHLDRAAVTAATAQVIKKRMGQCQNLYFATSANSPTSAWMPWELGYFDGRKNGHVAIMPLAGTQQGFPGQEYLGLYPTVHRPDSAGTRPYLALRPGSRTTL